MSQVVQKLIFKEKTTNHNVLLEPLGLIRDLRFGSPIAKQKWKIRFVIQHFPWKSFDILFVWLIRLNFLFDRVPGRPARMPGKMSGYRPGIPQQPYTKWDTDKDEVEVDYKRLDAKHSSWFSGRKGFVLKVITTLKERKTKKIHRKQSHLSFFVNFEKGFTVKANLQVLLCQV